MASRNAKDRKDALASCVDEMIDDPHDVDTIIIALGVGLLIDTPPLGFNSEQFVGVQCVQMTYQSISGFSFTSLIIYFTSIISYG